MVQKDPATKSRVLLINGAARNDGTCPGEISKTYRMTELAREVLEADGIEVDVLDLSPADLRLRPPHPSLQGCVSTAMPLCHWPCSCYPNHSLHQTNDWMNEIYEKWVAAHGILIVTPVYWYQTPAVLKLMIDRLVCADGGNPDPTTTHGKKAEEAKALELAGWGYPKHLADRAYGLIVHGDVAGIEGTRRGLSDWLDWMGLIDAGSFARLDRYIGYFESYAREPRGDGPRYRFPGRGAQRRARARHGGRRTARRPAVGAGPPAARAAPEIAEQTVVPAKAGTYAEFAVAACASGRVQAQHRFPPSRERRAEVARCVAAC